MPNLANCLIDAANIAAIILRPDKYNSNSSSSNSSSSSCIRIGGQDMGGMGMGVLVDLQVLVKIFRPAK